MTPTARLTLSMVLLGSWLVLLLSGIALAGTIHLLLVASLLAFPWRLRDDDRP